LPAQPKTRPNGRGRKKKKRTNCKRKPIYLTELPAVLDATPVGHLTFLITKTGKSYGANDFSEQFRQWCDAAGLAQRCTFHGLRKAGCRRLAERGCSASEIAAWSGQSLREVERYTKAADQARMARNAMARTTNPIENELLVQRNKGGAM
jgi:integrase